MNVIRRLLARRRLDRDLADEIRQHLEEKADALVDAGVPRDKAIRIARREFGNVTLIEERGRDVWRWQVVEDGLSDVRYAVRQWRRSPAFAAAAILTLALGIGANTAVFSAVSALVLRPLPFPDADRLVAVRAVDRRSSAAHRLSYPNSSTFAARRGRSRISPAITTPTSRSPAAASPWTYAGRSCRGTCSRRWAWHPCSAARSSRRKNAPACTPPS